MRTIDQETNHPSDTAYTAGVHAGRQAANGGCDENEATRLCAREAKHQEDSESYRDGFWSGFHNCP